MENCHSVKEASRERHHRPLLRVFGWNIWTAWGDKEYSVSLCSCDGPTVATTKAQRQAITSSLGMKTVPSSSKLGLIQAASCGLNLFSLHKLGREKSPQTAGSDWHLTLLRVKFFLSFSACTVFKSAQHDISERTIQHDEPI